MACQAYLQCHVVSFLELLGHGRHDAHGQRACAEPPYLPPTCLARADREPKGEDGTCPQIFRETCPVQALASESLDPALQSMLSEISIIRPHPVEHMLESNKADAKRGQS